MRAQKKHEERFISNIKPIVIILALAVLLVGSFMVAIDNTACINEQMHYRR